MSSADQQSDTIASEGLVESIVMISGIRGIIVVRSGLIYREQQAIPSAWIPYDQEC